LIESFPYFDSALIDQASMESSNSAAFACDQFSSDVTGTWYTFQGTDSCIEAFVGGSQSTLLAVYTGIDCGDLSCVVQSNYGDIVRWKADASETYWLLVGSIGYNGKPLALAINVSRAARHLTGEVS
jgi:hypothetical protein